MTNIAAFKTWAPDGALWTEWAKPVLFASMTQPNPLPLEIPEIRWMHYFNKNTAVIVDMPGKKGVEESLALAQIGYRPVPLYNGVCVENFSNMVVDVRDLSRALYAGAQMLAAMSIRQDAPPVFMLDSGRMRYPGKSPGMYDNRWCVFPQDMPSASFLHKQKITTVIVRIIPEETFLSNKIQDDLKHVLYRYQEAGIKIQHTLGSGINEVTVARPSQFKSLFYRFEVLMGLSRNAAGGFGSMIPDLWDSGDGSGRYYGIG